MHTARRVLARYLQASAVRVLVDRDATNKVREGSKECIVGRIDSPFTVYRVFDGEELVRVLRSGKISGGTYSVKVERAHGASWAASLQEVITVGNRRLRGDRYGDDLFIAKLEARGKTFAHLSPNVDFDPSGEPFQPATLQSTVCTFALGISMFADLNEVELFVCHKDDRVEPLSRAEAQEYVAKKPVKDVDLRKVNGTLLQGTIFGIDVRVWQDRGAWKVQTNDDRVIATNAPTAEDAIELAKIAIKLSPNRPVPTDYQILVQRKKHDKLFELDDNPDKIRRDFALKPRDVVEVTKGSRSFGIAVRDKLTVADVWQRPEDKKAVMVKLVNRNSKVFVLYAQHANRLNDDEIALMDSSLARILVRKQ